MSTEASAPVAMGWRFRLGVICFVAAFAIHLITLVAIALGVEAGTVAAIAATNFVVNKVLLLATVAILGKSGFNQLKGVATSFLGQYAPPQTVGRARYRFGLVLFVLPFLIGWLSPYLSGTIPALATHSLTIGIFGDLLLLVSLFVLGGEFWDKLRALFVHGATVSLPGERQMNTRVRWFFFAALVLVPVLQERAAIAAEVDGAVIAAETPGHNWLSARRAAMEVAMSDVLQNEATSGTRHFMKGVRKRNTPADRHSIRPPKRWSRACCCSS